MARRIAKKETIRSCIASNQIKRLGQSAQPSRATSCTQIPRNGIVDIVDWVDSVDKKRTGYRFWSARLILNV